MENEISKYPFNYDPAKISSVMLRCWRDYLREDLESTCLTRPERRTLKRELARIVTELDRRGENTK